MEHISKKRHALHSLKYTLLSKIDEICYIAKLTYEVAEVTGLSETKLDNTVLSTELEIEGYDLVRSDQSQRGGDVVCFVKDSVSYSWKSNFYINTGSIFIKIFLPTSKPVVIGILTS